MALSTLTAGVSPGERRDAPVVRPSGGRPGNCLGKATRHIVRSAPGRVAFFALKMARPDVTAFQRAHQELRNEAIDLASRRTTAAVVNASMSAR